MGLLWKLFMPRSVKRAFHVKTVLTHPARTAVRKVTPKPVKYLTNPVGYTKGAVENQVVRSVKGTKSKSTRTGPVVSCQHCGTRARGVMCPRCRRRMLPSR